MAIAQITAAAFPLQTINMRECIEVKDQGAKALSTLVHVTELDISGCSRITSRGLNYLGNGSITRKLRILRLVNMGEHAYDDGFRALILRSRGLTYLDVSDNEDRISDGCVGGILSTCKRLAHVVYGLPKPGLFTLECVARALGSENLDIRSHCGMLTCLAVHHYQMMV